MVHVLVCEKLCSDKFKSIYSWNIQ